jgi:hypothetical protein
MDYGIRKQLNKVTLVVGTYFFQSKSIGCKDCNAHFGIKTQRPVSAGAWSSRSAENRCYVSLSTFSAYMPVGYIISVRVRILLGIEFKISMNQHYVNEFKHKSKTAVKSGQVRL